MGHAVSPQLEPVNLWVPGLGSEGPEQLAPAQGRRGTARAVLLRILQISLALSGALMAGMHLGRAVDRRWRLSPWPMLRVAPGKGVALTG